MANPNLPGFTETRLRGWGERTRTRKCLFFVISAELLGFTEHFRTRDFSRTPGRDRFRSRRVKATFASYMPSQAVRSPPSPAPGRGRASSAAFRAARSRLELAHQPSPTTNWV